MPSMRSFAKINLFLEVVNRREDGYHNLESIFLEIDLADTLTAEHINGSDIILHCDAPGVPTDGSNLVVRAARLLADECGVRDGLIFRLDKRIPPGGGLGGGSSNAAAALKLANRLWGTGLSDADLAGLGARLGSDVPFFLSGGLCLCEGRGEIVTPLEAFPADIPLAVVVSAIHSDTAAAYRGLRLPEPAEARRAAAFLAALASGDADAMAREAFNRFEETVCVDLSELGEIRRLLERDTGLPVRLSGSGAGLWFFGPAEAARRAVEGNPELARLARRHGVAVLPVRAVASRAPAAE